MWSWVSLLRKRKSIKIIIEIFYCVHKLFTPSFIKLQAQGDWRTSKMFTFWLTKLSLKIIHDNQISKAWNAQTRLCEIFGEMLKSCWIFSNVRFKCKLLWNFTLGKAGFSGSLSFTLNPFVISSGVMPSPSRHMNHHARVNHQFIIYKRYNWLCYFQSFIMSWWGFRKIFCREIAVTK